MRFNDQVVWITGASSGIGAELALQLAREGARLILTARNEEALAAVRRDCIRHSPHCTLLPGDMLQSEILNELVQQGLAVHGRIDGLILSAGRTQRSRGSETSPSVYRQLMELNFFAPLLLTQALLPHFRERGSGFIVPLSSVAGLMGFPLRSGYAASKHALKGYFETLQTEAEIPGLHITIVSPGRIHTPISLQALTADGSPHGEMDPGQVQGIPVEVCARRILEAVRKRRRHLIIARSERILWWLWWFCRPLYYRIARKKGMG